MLMRIYTISQIIRLLNLCYTKIYNDPFWKQKISCFFYIIFPSFSSIEIHPSFIISIFSFLTALFIFILVYRNLQSFLFLFYDLGILDLILNFPGYHRWKFTDVLRNILKVFVSLFWVIILPLFYVHSFKGAPQGLKQLLSFSKQIRGIPAFYMLAVALYLLPNLLAQLFCFSSQC